MKILYDHQIFQIQKVGGISRGLAEIIKHFPRDVLYEISLKNSDNIYLNEYKLLNNANPIIHGRNTFLPWLEFRGKTKLYSLLSKFHFVESAEQNNLEYSIHNLKKGDFDVFHPTYFSDYFLKYLNKKPFVLTVHDLTTERFPQLFLKRDFQTEMRKVLVPLANHIIVPSEFTKQDILNHWGISSDKITVIYRGSNHKFQEKKSNRAKIIDNPYILFVGLRGGYKNFAFFLQQSTSFLYRRKDVIIVCTGSPFSIEEIDLIHKLNLTGRVKSIFADEEQMKSLYNHAICLVFPSLNEGFGLPTIEAFENGCPVLLYNGSCHPEIGGDAAFYFNIYNGESDISEKLYMIADMASITRDEVITKGYKRLSFFSWEKTSMQYVDVYRNMT